MGAYLYKVASKPCMVIDGEPVFDTSYAYKPYRSWDAEKVNSKLDFQTGVTSARRWWAKKTEAERENVLIKNYERIYRIPYCDGAVIDDWAFDRTPVHILVERP